MGVLGILGSVLGMFGKKRPAPGLKDTAGQGTTSTNPAAGGSLMDLIFGTGAEHPAGATNANPADTATTNPAVNAGGFNMASTPESQQAFTELLGAQKDVATKQAASIPSDGKAGLTSILGSIGSGAASGAGGGGAPPALAPVSQPQQQGAPAPSFLALLQSLMSPQPTMGAGSGGTGLGVPGQPSYEEEEDRKRRGYGGMRG